MLMVWFQMCNAPVGLLVATGCRGVSFSVGCASESWFGGKRNGILNGLSCVLCGLVCNGIRRGILLDRARLGICLCVGKIALSSMVAAYRFFTKRWAEGN